MKYPITNYTKNKNKNKKKKTNKTNKTKQNKKRKNNVINDVDRVFMGPKSFWLKNPIYKRPFFFST